MSRRHFEQSWSVEPHTWSVTSDEGCTTLEPETGGAALQVSAYRKGAGPVTDAELRAFAERTGLAGAASEATLGEFRGLTARYEDEQAEWQAWWLAAGPVHLYATYNGDPGCRDRDAADVARILSTLRASSRDTLLANESPASR